MFVVIIHGVFASVGTIDHHCLDEFDIMKFWEAVKKHEWCGRSGDQEDGAMCHELGDLNGWFGKFTGWWFGFVVLFSHLLGKIVPTDFHIFQRA